MRCAVAHDSYRVVSADINGLAFPAKGVPDGEPVGRLLLINSIELSQAPGSRCCIVAMARAVRRTTRKGSDVPRGLALVEGLFRSDDNAGFDIFPGGLRSLSLYASRDLYFCVAGRHLSGDPIHSGSRRDIVPRLNPPQAVRRCPIR